MKHPDGWAAAVALARGETGLRADLERTRDELASVKAQLALQRAWADGMSDNLCPACRQIHKPEEMARIPTYLLDAMGGVDPGIIWPGEE